MSYNLGVPQSSQQIKNTTSAINTNFVVANADFGVDHVDFTNAAPPGGNGGLHNKVSLLKQAADPTAAANTPIVFVENVTHTGAIVRSEEFIREASGDGGTVIALSNFFAAPVTNTNGSSFLPGIPVGVSGNYTSAGALIKWGTVQMLNGFSTIAVNFAALGIGNFPNNCFVALAIPNSAPAGLVAGNYPGTSNLATTGFNINRNGSGGAIFYQFVAIGN